MAGDVSPVAMFGNLGGHFQTIMVCRYTGSGKTHTVLGSDTEEGLYYKVCSTFLTCNPPSHNPHAHHNHNNHDHNPHHDCYYPHHAPHHPQAAGELLSRLETEHPDKKLFLLATACEVVKSSSSLS